MLIFSFSTDAKSEKVTFEKLYYSYRDMLYATALGIVKNPADAEDVLQNAFIKISKNLDCIKDVGSKSTAAFLTVITKNTAYDFLRERNKYREIPLYDTELPVSDDIIERIAFKTDYERLVAIIKSIPSPYNEVLFLHFVYELSAKETAHILSRKTATVKQQLVRAKSFYLKKQEGRQMNNSLLKKAFTEAQLNSEPTVRHSFSPQFEAKMNRIIRSKSRSYTFINTAVKRVACMILAALISLFGVACGVKQVREPIIREVKRIIVNISELFTGTQAEEISELLPTEVTKIIAFDHSDTAEAEYVIADADKIKSFVTLMTETAWHNSDSEITADQLNAYWSFEFYSADGSISARLDMCRNIFSQGAAVIVYNGAESNLFTISNKIYDELLCFTNKRYYLHDSSNEMPGEELCNFAAEIFFADMADDDIKAIRKEIRAAHYEVEKFLLENVTMLKSENSVYWNYLESGEIFIDPIADYERSFKVNNTVTEALKKAIITVNDIKAEAQLKKALKIWNDAVKAHDLDGLFTAHEYIHDIDYFCVNYPTHYVYDINVDFQGIDDYFGHIDSLVR